MKHLKSIVLVFVAVLAAIAEEYPRLVLELDFSKPDVLTSGPFQFKARERGEIKDGMLVTPQLQPEGKGGIMAVQKYPELDMKNAFSIEASFMVDNVKAVQRKMFFDSKYSYSNQRDGHLGGFMLGLETFGDNKYRPQASFGFGNEGIFVSGKNVTLEQGVMHSIRMLYTAIGDVVFTIDGKDAGKCKVKLGGIAKSEYPVCIGDRIGSTFCPFGNGIARIALYEEKPVYFSVFDDASYRKVFERGEGKPTLHYCLLNNSGADLEGASVVAGTERFQLGLWKNGECLKREVTLDNTLMHGNYALAVRILDKDGKELHTGMLAYTIVPAYREHLAIGLTGGGDIDEIREYGFTHFRNVSGIVVSRKPIGEDSKSGIMQRLDAALAGGLYQVYYVRPVTYFGKSPEDEKYLRRDRSGKIYPKNPLDVNNPELIKEICDLTESQAKALGDHPGWDLAVINSEVRDSMQPAFGGAEEENFRKFAGYPVPEEVTTKYPESYKGIKSFPWDRVLPENDKLLTYYRWLWGDGDGWNNIHSLVSDAVHRNLPHHHTTFFEPAIRNPPKWGSGGRVDTISQWTYTNPDPIKINQAFDELRAMADEHDGQEIFKETQIIWYRNQTAPIGVKVPNEPEWTSREPEAQYITISPDCLREAIWCDVSHRVQCLMFHGAECLFGNRPGSSYKYTNPDSKHVFKEMAYSVLRPLGPVIRLVPERLPEVAILESFTSSVFAPGHATSGWSKGWTADLHLALQWAHIQPSVIYEEHLLTGKKMDNVKVILLPGAEVLGEDVLRKLQEYQRNGVIIVGDEFTLPAIMPDIRISSVARTKNPQETKENLQKLGLQIAESLKGHYKSPIGASDQDIIVRRRGNDAADYVFIANDKRAFGNYLGPWKLVMEQGIPVTGKVTIGHPVLAAYDLVRHCAVDFAENGDGISFDVALAPGDGRMLLLLQQRIAGVKVRASASEIARGNAFDIFCDVVDDNGHPIKADIPVEVSLIASNGTELPGSGYYAAKGGQLTIHECAASNMPTGKVTVKVRDLASGQAGEASITVK